LTPVETRIEAVTVYPDRARVTRRGRTRAAAGHQGLVVEDLPADLLPESVRAAARAAVPARLLGTEVTRRFHGAPAEAEVAELQQRVEALQDRDESLVRQTEAQIVRRSFLQSLANAAGEQLARGIALGRSPVETGATINAFLAEQLAAVDTEALAVTRERRAVGGELAAAKSRLENRRRARPTEAQRVVVLLEAEAEGEVELEITYQLPGASWEPLYDVRLEEVAGGARVNLLYLAQVTQRTGETWEGVSLTLSTARPGLGTLPPELSPWFLHAPQRGPLMARKRAGAPAARFEGMALAAAGAAPLAESEFDAAEELPLIQVAQETAVVEGDGPAVSFQAPGRPDIPADGSPHKVTLAGYEFPARLDYVAAPKLVGQAYRRARATNGAALLLAGPANVFVEGEFVGVSRFRNTAPGEEFVVFLGVDDRIRVERRLVEGAVDRKFLVDVRRLTYAYEIKVTNLKPGPELVTLLDQLPVSRHESVKIRPGEIRPPAARQSELGRLEWELRLGPGEERSVRFAFAIEGPRDLELVGLPPLLDPPA
jgi:uncharacterized protein (TIGR02231 family)